jgi:polyribonucleotide nucleotidyltransferase
MYYIPMNSKQYTLEVGGKTLTAEFNDLAEQANGSVMLRYGNTIVLATAVMGKEEKKGDFFPLTVDYEERFYASGKILGSRFIRREGRPSDEAILSGRIVDRTIRPLFEQHIRYEVQVVLTVLSIDEDDPDVISVIAASLALGTSNIPWNGPVSAVRIAKNEGFHINPNYKQRDEAGITFDLVACGKDGLINMIEVGGKEVSEDDVNKALAKASEEIEKIQKWQEEIFADVSKARNIVKKIIPKPELTEGTKELFNSEIKPKLSEYVFSGPGKEKLAEIASIWTKTFTEKLPEGNLVLAQEYLDEEINDLIHKEAIENNKRPDGRTMDEIRPLFVKAGGISPILHGSGIFYRGATHVMSVLTLGGPGDAQEIDGMEESKKGGEGKRFMHHYNFPPFSTGETGRVGGTNRRMIGHGALAEKSLLPVIPAKEIFPYTIRIVSEAFSSNGSTSMGSVCGSTLALMDGGIPIKSPVAGIASGLMMREAKAGVIGKMFGKKNYEYKVLTDIQGPEDHHGDMDFKVAGTRNGITAIQMDVKVDGIPLPILAEAFEKAKIARFQILDLIEKEISKPREKISPNAPEILTLTVKQDQIGLVIGTGGKTIKEIKEKTAVDDITIEDDGTIFITGKNGTAQKAKEVIYNMTREYKAGERFEGEVTKVTEFGAFVKIAGNTEGLVHVSEIAPFRIDRVNMYLKEGMKVPVVVREIDERGRISLSIKQVDPNFIKKK